MRPFVARGLALTLALSAACAARQHPPHPPPRPPPPGPPHFAPGFGAPRRPPFSCRGPDGPPPFPRIVTAATGDSRLTVAPVGARPTSLSADSTRVRVTALQATAGALGIELSRVLGTAVVVTPDAASARVTLAGEFTLDRLHRALGTHGVALRIDPQGLTIDLAWARAQRSVDLGENRAGNEASPPEGAHQLLIPMETTLVPVPYGIDPVELASAWCRHMASHDGRASVIGQALLVVDRGRGGRLEHLVQMLESLRRPPPAPQRPADATAPATR